MDIIRLLLLFTLASIIPGQLIRISLGTNAAFTLTDTSVIVTVLAFYIHHLFLKEKIHLVKKITFFFVIFILTAISSTVLALNSFSTSEVFLGALFLLRFIFYFSITIVVHNVVKKEQVDKWLKAILTIGLTFAAIGILQLLIFPDLRFLAKYGWDPHINRLVSTLIDPNFAGGLINIFVAIALGLYIFKKQTIYLIFSILFAISIILTFSRSAYFAFLALIASISIIKSSRRLLVIVIIFIVLVSVIPKSRERVIGAFKIDETARSRIESWRGAYSIFSKNYLFGVGFNTFRYAQAQSGTFATDNPQGGHSGAGVDSSMLLVAATTGVVGLLAFSIFLLSILKNVQKRSSKNYLKLITITSFISLMVHSQFVNSLFFPQIMVIFWFLLGLNFVLDKQSTQTN